MGEVIATRAAYGKALVEFGSQYPNLVVLDADLASAPAAPGSRCATRWPTPI